MDLFFRDFFPLEPVPKPVEFGFIQNTILVTIQCVKEYVDRILYAIAGFDHFLRDHQNRIAPGGPWNIRLNVELSQGVVQVQSVFPFIEHRIVAHQCVEVEFNERIGTMEAFHFAHNVYELCKLICLNNVILIGIEDRLEIFYTLFIAIRHSIAVAVWNRCYARFWIIQDGAWRQLVSYDFLGANCLTKSQRFVFQYLDFRHRPFGNWRWRQSCIIQVRCTPFEVTSGVNEE